MTDTIIFKPIENESKEKEDIQLAHKSVGEQK